MTKERKVYIRRNSRRKRVKVRRWSYLFTALSVLLLILLFVAMILDIRTTNNIKLSLVEYVLLFVSICVTTLTSIILEAFEEEKIKKLKAHRAKAAKFSWEVSCIREGL